MKTRPRRPEAFPEDLVALWLRTVASGDLAAVEAQLLAYPGIANAVGPHPYWGGRPQALHVAIETNRAGMVKLLLRHGADVNGTNDQYDHWSPLLLTSGEPKKANLRRMLLRRGARIGLSEALAAGDDRKALAMLKRGRRALPRAAPNDGSLLAFARTTRAVDRLLALGVSPDAKDRWGATPMEAFSRRGPRGKRLVRHLMAKGIAAPPEIFARLNDRVMLERMARSDPSLLRRPAVLKAAVDFGHHRLAAWLIDQGADPSARGGGEADETPLHSAAWNGDAKMVELLLQRGANPAVRDRKYDGTPAGWAATAVEVTNNAKCGPIAERLALLAPARPA